MGLRKPRTIITGIIITGIMVAVPSLLTGTIIALTGRGEVIARRQLVEGYLAASWVKLIFVILGILGAGGTKVPATTAARIVANSLLDRGWGKAAQFLAIEGEIRQLVEVKLSVVQAPAASHALPSNANRLCA